MALDKLSVPVASRTGSVTVQIKGGSLSEYTDIGCLVGAVDLVRAWANNATEETDVWCINQDGTVAIVPFEAGAMTGTSTLQLEAVLSNTAYKFLSANNPDSPFSLKFVLVDALTPVTTQTMEYTVVKTGDTLNIRGERGATTRYSLDIQITAIIAETIVTAT